MRILFYLPVVTPWWFNEIIAPMLRALHGVAELHVMVAPPWRNTGIDGDNLAAVADLDRIQWHVVESDDPAQFRTDGAAVPGLLDRVREIGPDLTLARSADLATPALFPGTLRFIMEGAAAPFDTDPRWVVLEERPFAHGVMPADRDDIAQACADALAPLREQAARRMAAQPPTGWRSHFGLPATRPILAVPLQYEHEENFFSAHSLYPRATDLIHHLFATLDTRVFLAFTDHPLNRRHVDRSDVHALIASNAERALLCEADKLPLGSTGLFAARADAMLVDQTKSWSLAAFAGTPIVRIGHAPSAGWLNAKPDLTGAFDRLVRPDAEAARRWFGWHLGARIVDPTAITLDSLLANIAGTPDEAGIAANLDRLIGRQKEAA